MLTLKVECFYTHRMLQLLLDYDLHRGQDYGTGEGFQTLAVEVGLKKDPRKWKDISNTKVFPQRRKVAG